MRSSAVARERTRDVVLIPCWRRPEFLWHCLENLTQADADDVTTQLRRDFSTGPLRLTPPSTDWMGLNPGLYSVATAPPASPARSSARPSSTSAGPKLRSICEALRRSRTAARTSALPFPDA